MKFLKLEFGDFSFFLTGICRFESGDLGISTRLDPPHSTMKSDSKFIVTMNSLYREFIVLYNSVS